MPCLENISNATASSPPARECMHASSTSRSNGVLRGEGIHVSLARIPSISNKKNTLNVLQTFSKRGTSWNVDNNVLDVLEKKAELVA